MKYNLILNQLKDLLEQIEVLTNFNNLSSDNSKKSRDLGKKVDKFIQQLLQTNEGIEAYKSWLSLDDYNLKWNAALNLYPLYPKKCLDSLIECYKVCQDELTKSAMKDVISAYKKPINDNNIFFSKLKKVYNTNDLASLKRE